jgi:menaquinone-specific isochorismate synthase
VSASPRSPVPERGWPTSAEVRAPALTVTSRFSAVVPTDIVAALPEPTGAVSFLSEGDGLVGWGVFARFAATGVDAAAQIARWWADLCARFDITDEVSLTGSGPIVFVSLGFSPTDTAVAIVPRTVLGSREGRRFTTTIEDPELPTSKLALSRSTPMSRPGRVSYSDGNLPVPDFIAAVQTAVARIRDGDLRKVVLAHDLLARTEFAVDERHLLVRLAAAYPTCWTFAVEGLIGASPEMLIRRHGRKVSSRVLAGTAWPEHAGEHTAGTVATHLLASQKDLDEHVYAVDSVAEVLRGISGDVRVPRTPRALPLANLTHLSTDITARLPPHAGRGPLGPSSALGLAARLHPTAAVGGTPRAAALRLIGEQEPTNRGRYAAPVGWMDHNGDGEFAIALRCAQVNGDQVRLIAGCGIVAESDPETEAREAQIKMVPIRDALEH